MRNKIVVLVCLALGLSLAATADGQTDQVAAKIVGTALVESRAYDKLVYLSDRIGHRLSGSEALEAAVRWTAAEFERDGVEHVWTEKVMVPRWVRGHGVSRIIAPVEWEMATLALGGSVGTAEGGITAEVVEVSDFDELESVGDAVRGKIVLFNQAMDEDHGYGTVVKMRGGGASRAAKLGAVGMLIRSLGTADYRLPHTGALRYEKDVPKIPAAAIAAEDAELIHRLLESGDPVRVTLDLGCETLPDSESANVIAELRGREKPEEIVLIGAHLDSWDVGQGAHDNGSGCAVVMETMRLLVEMGLTPRRTIRAVLFTNEENGLRGGRDYAERHRDDHHVAAIESDSGGAAPRGFGITAGEGGVTMLEQIARHLAPIGADEIRPRGGGADIGPLRKQGVPVIGLRQDTERYFDYHHTEADTVDKIDRHDLDKSVAAMTLAAYMLAEQEELLPRLEPDPPQE